MSAENGSEEILPRCFDTQSHSRGISERADSQKTCCPQNPVWLSGVGDLKQPAISSPHSPTVHRTPKSLHTHMRTRTHTRTHTCTHTCTHTHAHTRAHTHAHNKSYPNLVLVQICQ